MLAMNAPIVSLRHAVATLAYRAAKMLRDTPPGFETLRCCPKCRTAGEIVGHLGDLIEWAERAACGDTTWVVAPPASWDASVVRLFAALSALDERLTSQERLGCSAEKMFQGPIADALTHVGQLATLRRIAGAPIRGESYVKSDIAAGRVGPEQTPPAFEFD